MSFKKIFVFILFFGSVWFQGVSQEGDVLIEEDENEEWIKIIDYLSARLTYEYILELDRNNQLSSLEMESFDGFREQLANNAVDRPISPGTLETFTEEEFRNTYNKLSLRIYGLKNIQKKSEDNIFQEIDSILKLVESSLVNSDVYDEIRYNVYSELDENEGELDSSSVAPEEVSNSESKSDSFLPEWFFKALSGFLFVSTTFYFFLYRHNRDKARRLEKSLKKSTTAVEQSSREGHHSNRKWSYGSDSHIKPQSSIGSEKRKRKSEYENYDNRRVSKDNSNKSEGISDSKFIEREKEALVEEADNKDIESETQPLMNKKLPCDLSSDKILYAGKPTNDGWFKDAERLKGDNHIYELNLSNESEAEFSLLELSKYMETEVINSPDDYLYRVCINENSNQEYRNEIITTKRGVAHKLDGKWKVNEEDKATIKFQ